MQRIHVSGQQPLSLFLTVSLALLLVFVFAACGSNGVIGSSSGPTPTATPQPTIVQGHGTDNGCPNDAVVATASTANVTVKLADAHSTVMAHVGDVIEIQLPFGLRWTSPPASVGELQLQTPAGYAATATKMCIWHYSAQSAGIAHLTFLARVICKKDILCPLAVRVVIFTIEVK